MKNKIGLTSDEFIEFIRKTNERLRKITVTPEPTKEEDFALMKKLVDDTPDKWLEYQLNQCLKYDTPEQYRLAAYIKEVAKRRGVKITTHEPKKDQKAS